MSIYRYVLQDKFERPEYPLILLTGHAWCKYFLYKEDEIEKALNQLKVEEIKGNFPYIGVARYYHDWGYKVQRLFGCEDGKIFYYTTREFELHFEFYCSAGIWLNPRKD